MRLVHLREKPDGSTAQVFGGGVDDSEDQGCLFLYEGNWLDAEMHKLKSIATGKTVHIPHDMYQEWFEEQEQADAA